MGGLAVDIDGQAFENNATLLEINAPARGTYESDLVLW
tara:strand:- start:110 stop:223 length:114 start_codon:yes stop_codon:yes gene_type:complete